MSIRLLAIDIDGTLLDSRWELPPANCDALAAAAELQIEIVLVTGRRLHTARPIAAKLPCPATLITTNGALITTPEGEEPYRNFLPLEQAQEVLRATRDYRGYAVAIFHQEGRGQLLMEEGALSEGPLRGYLQRYPQQLRLVAALEEGLVTDPIQVSFAGPVKRMEEAYETLCNSPVAAGVHLSKTDYAERDLLLVDVLNQGCNKGTALAYWAKRQGVAAEEVMALGDNYNDYEMLRFAGLPVVMGNSPGRLAGNGWAVTAGSDEAGVAAAIRKYVLAE